ncbi:MAG TPA: curli assembly protein CsgF [Skermanella sp.]|jgi:curli production assembly/transport component CsgF|nr:curli assembly protein CsgF [Skermanella sp.]
MARVSHYIVAGTILLVSLNGAAAAGQLTYRPINPSFGGDPFNSAHLLGIANANDRYKDPDAVDIDEVLDNIDFGTAGTTNTGTTGTAGNGVLTDGIGNGTSSGTANTNTNTNSNTSTGTSSGAATSSGLGLSVTPNSDGSFTIR